MEHSMGPGRGHEPWSQSSRTEETRVADERDARVPDPRAETAEAPHGGTPTRPDAEADSGRPWHLRPRGIDMDDVRSRWHATQGAFIDDPERAVREADELATEVCDAVVAEMDARRTALRSAWEGGEGRDTESLRLAMRDYRVFVENVIGGDV